MDTKAFAQFLDGSRSLYHAQQQVVSVLEQAGCRRLPEEAPWHLEPGQGYYVTRGQAAVIAFWIPEGKAGSFLISASHCDRPGLKLKENFTLTGPYTRVGVEVYGGAILSTWLDRPLSVAGRVCVDTPEGIRIRLVDLDEDLLLIPNVAIHMNRQVNEGYKWNPAVDMLPLAAVGESHRLEQLLQEAAGGQILGKDLYLYPRQKATVWGAEGEFISAQGLDDLECVWGCTQGFLKAQAKGSIPVLCVLDSEEVGSVSPQGAASTFLAQTLERICAGLNLPLAQLLAQSLLVSADNAHAQHPNHPELSDSANAPLPGKGVVVKFSASMSYSTDGVAAALFRKICRKAHVPVQVFANRADLPGGRTLGCISSGKVSIPTVDIGLAQLAMHSCYETGALADADHLIRAMTAFYSCAPTVTETGWQL